jgi:hypothetical protein
VVVVVVVVAVVGEDIMVHVCAAIEGYGMVWYGMEDYRTYGMMDPVSSTIPLWSSVWGFRGAGTYCMIRVRVGEKDMVTVLRILYIRIVLTVLNCRRIEPLRVRVAWILSQKITRVSDVACVGTNNRRCQ